MEINKASVELVKSTAYTHGGIDPRQRECSSHTQRGQECLGQGPVSVPRNADHTKYDGCLKEKVKVVWEK